MLATLAGPTSKLPPIIAVPCDTTIALPASGGLSAGAAERAIFDGIAKLRLCGLKHAAAVSAYERFVDGIAALVKAKP